MALGYCSLRPQFWTGTTKGNCLQSKQIKTEAVVRPLHSRSRELVAVAYPAKSRTGRRFSQIPFMFLSFVLAPSICTAVYLIAFASPLFVSEARFVVRASGQQAPTGIGAILQGTSLGQSSNEAFAVLAYMNSRQATQSLDDAFDLRRRLAPAGADFLTRFPRPWDKTSFEHLHEGFQRFLEVSYDSTSGISVLKVKAFTPKDAHAMASLLLDGGEDVVNRMNDRATSDGLLQAEAEVARAESRVNDLQSRITKFRNEAKLIDPGRSSAEASQLVGRLDQDLAALRAQRREIEVSAPLSPQLPIIDTRISALSAQIASERSKIAGNGASLAPKIGEYESMEVQRQIADRALDAAISFRERARIEAQQKKLYLERVVPPATPDSPAYPRRFQVLATVVASLFAAYAMLLLVIAGIRERRHD